MADFRREPSWGAAASGARRRSRMRPAPGKSSVAVALCRSTPRRGDSRWCLVSSFCLRASGQSYSLDWYEVAGGGGTSTGATYQVIGTIGQPDAGGATSGGQYSVTGGFWSLIAVVQTAGAPTLTITHSGNSVTVSWPMAANGFGLQQNNNVANPAGWSAYGGTVSTNSGVNSITISPPTGNLFFRLANP